jgi:phosphohistidine phosphatase
MKTVLLLRHAKSDWSGTGLSDRERPLSPRGLKAAPRMGAYIARSGHAPDLVICSPARRAQQTCALAVAELPSSPSLATSEAFYDFSGEEAYLDAIQSAPENINKVMLVGHNPTMYHLADMLVGSGDADLRAELAEKYPSAALAIITFEVENWRAIAPGQGNLLDFTKPKEIHL